MKTKIQELTKKMQRHKRRRTRHAVTLAKPNLTEKQRIRAHEGFLIQSSIIDKLKFLREEARKTKK